jgi:hypothetical protein
MTARSPLILRIAQISPTASPFDARDFESTEDPLGSVVELGTDGMVVIALTKWTNAAQETTDDK